MNIEQELEDAFLAKKLSEERLVEAMRQIELVEHTVAMTHEAVRMVRDTVGLVQIVITDPLPPATSPVPSSGPTTLTSRSCPSCHSIGTPRDGCRDLWHVEVRHS